MAAALLLQGQRGRNETRKRKSCCEPLRCLHGVLSTRFQVRYSPAPTLELVGTASCARGALEGGFCWEGSPQAGAELLTVLTVSPGVAEGSGLCPRAGRGAGICCCSSRAGGCLAASSSQPSAVISLLLGNFK